jgi:hypothetical protein
MASVRAALDPLNTALGRPPNYFVVASFVGLPLINQALARLHPLPGNAFYVTLRGLMDVVASIPPGNVVAALHPPPPPGPGPGGHPPPPPPPPPPKPTIGYTFVGADPGDSAARDYLIAGAHFPPNEVVDILDAHSGFAVSATNADGAGGYSVTLAFSAGTVLQLFALGEKSKQQSNMISFVA